LFAHVFYEQDQQHHAKKDGEVYEKEDSLKGLAECLKTEKLLRGQSWMPREENALRG